MTWQVILTRPARSDLRNVDPPIAARILRAIENLAAEGHDDVRALTDPGLRADYALRVGDWRVLFNRDAAERTLIVIRVRHRREVYRDR